LSLISPPIWPSYLSVIGERRSTPIGALTVYPRIAVHAHKRSRESTHVGESVLITPSFRPI